MASKSGAVSRAFLLVLGLAMGGLHALLLLLSAGFGPSGFGGDGRVTAADIERAHHAEAAAVVGVVLALACLVAFVSRRRLTHPTSALAVLVITELALLLYVVTVSH